MNQGKEECKNVIGTHDAQGYPRGARRRLTNRDDAGTVTDVDTGQRFKVKKTKHGDRIVPLFDKNVYWKSASGYDALRLCLSCLGTPGEYVLWDEAASAEMTREEWCKRKFVNKSKPPIRHSCGQIVRITPISSIGQGKSVGCATCVPQLMLWSGRFAEFASMLPEGYVIELTENEWKKKATNNLFCPPIRCSKHQETTATSCIANIQRGQGIGCPKCYSKLNLWSGRYIEFVSLLRTGFTLQMTEVEWKEQCTGACWCPPILCDLHKTVSETSRISDLVRGEGVGCRKCVSGMMPWSERYFEFLQLLPVGFVLQLTETEWERQCTGNNFCPPIQCKQHETVTTTTSLANIQRGQGVGCVQCVPLLARKTEAAVLQWIESAFPAVLIAREVAGPRKMRFDFVLKFGGEDECSVVVEVDGPQHFWKDHFMHGCGMPERDAEKARWALARGQSVVRVLANDVFHDRNGWRAWLRRAIDEARAAMAVGAAPRVITPNVPEYRSQESEYVRDLTSTLVKE